MQQVMHLIHSLMKNQNSTTTHTNQAKNFSQIGQKSLIWIVRQNIIQFQRKRISHLQFSIQNIRLLLTQMGKDDIGFQVETN